MAGDPELKRIVAGVQDTLARQERAFERQERAFERQERAFAFQVQTFENLIAATERMIERLDDMGDQIRASTQAVLRALDRLDGPRPSEG
jgi:Skp family chaperone for outer membrane proteins